MSIGERYGDWTVIGITKSRYSIDVKCKCGNVRHKDRISLHLGRSRMCRECSYRETPMFARSQKPSGWNARTQAYHRVKNAAEDRGIEFFISKDEFYLLSSRDCSYCGRPPSNLCSAKSIKTGEYKYSGMDRLDSSGPYSIENVVPCCAECNRGKQSMTIKEFLEWIKKLYQNREKINELCKYNGTQAE